MNVTSQLVGEEKSTSHTRVDDVEVDDAAKTRSKETGFKHSEIYANISRVAISVS